MIQSREDEIIDSYNDKINHLYDLLEEEEEACNKWKKAFNIVMEYSVDLPDCDYDEMTKRLKAIGI